MKISILTNLKILLINSLNLFLLLGDFNAHSPMWGNSDYNEKGKTIENLISSNNICLLNDGSATYIHSNGSPFAIDLSFCSPSLYSDLSWSVFEDLHGSDHFPIKIDNPYIHPESIPRWNFNKASWETFHSLCYTELSSDNCLNSEDPVLNFSENLIKIAEKSIPKTPPKPKQSSKCWFNKECRDAVQERKRSLKALRANFNDINLKKIQSN